jgi:hypothetical protein
VGGEEVGGEVVDTAVGGDGAGGCDVVAMAPGVLPGRVVPHPESVDVIINASTAPKAVARDRLITSTCYEPHLRPWRKLAVVIGRARRR